MKKTSIKPIFVSLAIGLGACGSVQTPEDAAPEQLGLVIEGTDLPPSTDGGDDFQPFIDDETYTADNSRRLPENTVPSTTSRSSTTAENGPTSTANPGSSGDAPTTGPPPAPPTSTGPSTTSAPDTTSATANPTTEPGLPDPTTTPPRRANPTTPSTATPTTGPSSTNSPSAAAPVPSVPSSQLTPSGQIVISGQSNVVLENLHITTTSGHCLKIRDSTNVTIKNSIIGPCGDRAVDIFNSSGVNVSGNKMTETNSGVHATSSASIQVTGNHFLHAGRNFTQFDKVTGPNNKINGNWGENSLGGSNAEDLINLFATHGTAQSPLEVIGNHFRNGGPSDSGSGIMTGDRGGSHIVVRGNVLVNPGQVGIGVAGGHHITVEDNLIFSDGEYFANVGMYAWDLYSEGCSNITFKNNKVNWKSGNGTDNPWWEAGDCGTINGLVTNDMQAGIGPDVYLK